MLHIDDSQVQTSSEADAAVTVFWASRKQASSKLPCCSRLAKGTRASHYTALFTLSAHLSLLSTSLLLERQGSLGRDCKYFVVYSAPSRRKGLSWLLAGELRRRWDPFTARMCMQIDGTARAYVRLQTWPKMLRERDWAPFPTNP